MVLKNKIDFALVITAEMCNPNGDPLNMKRPRMDYDGYGEISSVCIKRKIRNRLQDMGEKIFVQADDRIDDGYKSLFARAKGCTELENEIKKKKGSDADICTKIACKEWIDVRSFGQVMAFHGENVSLGIRGPVSIGFARSIEPIYIMEIQITKSTNAVEKEGRDSATMGRNYIIQKGVYVAYGSIFPQLAEKTGFTDKDAELIKEALKTLFENDASTARPSGSMSNVLYWWKHPGKYGTCSSSKVFQSLKIMPQDEYPYFSAKIDAIDGLIPEVYRY